METTPSAALDFAIEQDIPTGDGVPGADWPRVDPFQHATSFRKPHTRNYPQRTEKNVLNSDGTVIFTFAAKLGDGSKKTAEFAQKHGKPWLHLFQENTHEPATELRRFPGRHPSAVLNVTGSRASKEADVHDLAKRR